MNNFYNGYKQLEMQPSQAETFKGNLEGMANSLAVCPDLWRATVEEFQAFIRANTEGGDGSR